MPTAGWAKSEWHRRIGKDVKYLLMGARVQEQHKTEIGTELLVERNKLGRQLFHGWNHCLVCRKSNGKDPIVRRRCVVNVQHIEHIIERGLGATQE